MQHFDLASFEKSARAATRLLRVLANEKRLMVLCELTTQERSVGDLAGRVGLSASAISQHLAKLKADKVVVSRRDAQTIYYRLADSPAAKVLRTLAEIFCPPPMDKSSTKPSAKARARAKTRRPNGVQPAAD
jgi:ArsR family transcriptional regulator, virulence genes transcriptional regulator